MSMERFPVSMDETDVDLFERKRADMGMNKSAFIRFLLAEHEDKVPSFLKYKEVINKLADLNTSVKELILLDKISDTDKLHIYEQIREMNDYLNKLMK